MKNFLPVILALILGVVGYHHIRDKMEQTQQGKVKKMEEDHQRRLDAIIQSYEAQLRAEEADHNREMAQLKEKHQRELREKARLWEKHSADERKKAFEAGRIFQDNIWNRFMIDTLRETKSRMKAESRQIFELLKAKYREELQKRDSLIQRLQKQELETKREPVETRISFSPVDYFPETNESLTWLFQTLFQVILVLIILRLFYGKSRRRF